MLGYPSRALLTQWVKELAPQPRKFKRNGLKLTSEEKEAAVLALLTRGDTSAQSIADKVGVSRESLYKYKDQLLGKGVPINKRIQILISSRIKSRNSKKKYIIFKCKRIY